MQRLLVVTLLSLAARTSEPCLYPTCDGAMSCNGQKSCRLQSEAPVAPACWSFVKDGLRCLRECMTGQFVPANRCFGGWVGFQYSVGAVGGSITFELSCDGLTVARGYVRQPEAWIEHGRLACKVFGYTVCNRNMLDESVFFQNITILYA